MTDMQKEYLKAYHEVVIQDVEMKVNLNLSYHPDHLIISQ